MKHKTVFACPFAFIDFPNFFFDFIRNLEIADHVKFYRGVGIAFDSSLRD